MADNNANGSQAGQGEQSQQSQADTTNTQSQADTSNQNSNQSTIKSLEDAQKVIEDLRKEQASNRKKLKDFEAAQTQAETERQAIEATKLKEAGEFKALYEKTEGKLKELEPIQGKYEKLAGLTKSRFEAETKEWPKEVLDLLPKGDDTDVLELAESIEKYRPLATKLLSNQSGSGYGRNGAGPNPAGQAQPDLEKARAEHGRLYATNY
jgi:hypothetical protein